MCWALAAGGADALTRALGVLADELDNVMALLGVREPAELTRAHVVRSAAPWSGDRLPPGMS
jgi:isopentenyl diphosphate isomerase/L-lactate dehydrogenase-like FMN-dependent dehydrogenase